jgi:phospholipid/cholesterol/gamma-HCH transport system substrate-binding protein
MSAKKEIQVGVTVIVSLTILIWGLLWFKQVRFSGGVDHYYVEFPSVGGLQQHDRVQVRGIRLGAVEDFVMNDELVRVRFYVEQGTGLRQDAVVTLQSQGIVGEMLLEVLPGRGEPAPQGFVYKGRVLQDMNAMMNEGAETLSEARDLTREVTAFLNEMREGGRLGGLVDDARGAAATLRGTTEELAPELKDLVAELQATTSAVHAAVAGPDSLLAGGLRDAGLTLARADTMMVLISQTTAALAALVTRLESGEGTVGRALSDDSLYAEAESTIVMVQDLIADIKARPKRYFHVSLF